MSYLHETWRVFTDPAHVTAEAMWEVVTFCLLVWPARKVLERHDRNKHGGMG